VKERKLKIIVIVMTAAVIGLISVQLYWISNLIKVEDERFHRIVNDAMMRVSHRVEEEEAAKAVVKKIAHKSGKEPVEINAPKNVQSSNKVFVWSEGKDENVFRVVADSNHLNLRVNSFGDSSRHGKYKKFIAHFTDDRNEPPPPPFSRQYYLDTLISSRKKLVQNVVAEIMMTDVRKKIEERISSNQLNNLLTQELKNSGVDGSFYFGVNKLKIDSLTLVKPGADVSELRKSDLRTMLFPGEFFFNKNELVVYFPNKALHLLGSIAGMMSLSIGLILIIVIVFYNTLRMLLKQKKITQIKNDLINNITHEFKTPISTISLACEALNEPGLMTEKNSVNRYSNIIKEESDRLKIMVDALLNTAAMEKSDFNLKKESVDLHEIIKNASAKFAQIVHKRNGKIEFDLTATSPNILGDSFHLSNIFSNLIDNGIKYNENKPIINVKTLNSGDFIFVIVKDNGIGIPKEYLGKIFDTFYRVSGGNIQNVRGNGIGLSYVKRIVEEHDGRISVHSETDKGSEFEIRFPLIRNR